MYDRLRKGLAGLLMLVMTLTLLTGCSVTGGTASDTGIGAFGVTAETSEAQVETEPQTETETQAESKSQAAIEPQSQVVPQSQTESQTQEESQPGESADDVLDEHGSYTSKDEVALYLHTYGHLPDNYMTKKDAQDLGWDSKKGNLWDVAPGMSIGGSHFGNYEEQLPVKKGRKYFECDLDYEGGYRGEKRLVYSSDGLIFYTEDHYETFEQLY
ncbi:MAG: ribonuclease domain-containing protein [Eubacteriales bacterium]|nr:ribonuclease domain-containing protein [Eubacteriales bacterium]